MKTLAYLFVFVLILGGIGFAFFSMATPNIPQQTITKTLDPKDAFPAPAPVAAPAPATSIAPAPAPTPAPTEPAPAAAPAGTDE